MFEILIQESKREANFQYFQAPARNWATMTPKSQESNRNVPKERLLNIFASSDLELSQTFTNSETLHFEDSGTFLNSVHELEQRSSQGANFELSKTGPEPSPHSFARSQCWAFSKYWLKKASEKSATVPPGTRALLCLVNPQSTELKGILWFLESWGILKPPPLPAGYLQEFGP